jgi:hypothetical protein
MVGIQSPAVVASVPPNIFQINKGPLKEGDTAFHVIPQCCTPLMVFFVRVSC